ncbi:7-cyano-7-deazaguanine synthase [Candidatus Pacearchaeota archaeon]|nr:7-cyano-7-deazaguanine synthase [Candidatus Pacearchaeota archaeon]
MFSGGLDSRLAVKIMQEKGFEVIALFFKLPFMKNDERKLKDFCKKEKFKLKIFDITKGKLLKKYLNVIKEARHGVGSGVNSCIDCRIFMLKKAKKFADDLGVKMIVTGEVLGQRPMSQHKKGLDIVEKESGLVGRLFRALFEEGIEGRRRKKQITLAKKFKIKYPSPAGGCLLCEKELKKRLKFLLKRGLNEEEIKLVGVGRHFLIDTLSGHENLQAGNYWVVIGRNKDENEIIEGIKEGEIIMPDFKGPSGVIFGENPTHPTQKLPAHYDSQMDKKVNRKKIRTSESDKSKIIKKVNKLIKVYSKIGSLKDRMKWEKFKL